MVDLDVAAAAAVTAVVAVRFENSMQISGVESRHNPISVSFGNFS